MLGAQPDERSPGGHAAEEEAQRVVHHAAGDALVERLLDVARCNCRSTNHSDEHLERLELGDGVRHLAGEARQRLTVAQARPTLIGGDFALDAGAGAPAMRSCARECGRRSPVAQGRDRLQPLALVVTVERMRAGAIRAMGAESPSTRTTSSGKGEEASSRLSSSVARRTSAR